MPIWSLILRREKPFAFIGPLDDWQPANGVGSSPTGQKTARGCRSKRTSPECYREPQKRQPALTAPTPLPAPSCRQRHALCGRILVIQRLGSDAVPPRPVEPSTVSALCGLAHMAPELVPPAITTLWSATRLAQNRPTRRLALSSFPDGYRQFRAKRRLTACGDKQLSSHCRAASGYSEEPYIFFQSPARSKANAAR